MSENVTNNEISVGMADIKIGKSPRTIATVLGSCVGVCLYSQKNKVGGLLHLMIDSSAHAADKTNIKKAKYADTGIQEMLRQLKNSYGLDAKDFSAKIFGGAKVLINVQNTVGADNQKSVKEILRNYNITISASKLGGEKGYRIAFNLETGRVNCRVFGQNPEEY